ncbi:MAG: hypothetical protein FJX89_05340 [Bacteroidetes bacterium]|nr:hypothetical protein [Bacteroidota bacterium]
MKYVNYLLADFFLLFAALQYNDPDPWLWIPIYLYAAIACARAAKGKVPRGMLILGIAFCSVYATLLFLIPDGVIEWAGLHQAENLVQTMKATKPWIENTREFGGLLIILAALGFNLLRRGKE